MERYEAHRQLLSVRHGTRIVDMVLGCCYSDKTEYYAPNTYLFGYNRIIIRFLKPKKFFPSFKEAEYSDIFLFFRIIFRIPNMDFNIRVLCLSDTDIRIYSNN